MIILPRFEFIQSLLLKEISPWILPGQMDSPVMDIISSETNQFLFDATPYKRSGVLEESPFFGKVGRNHVIDSTEDEKENKVYRTKKNKTQKYNRYMNSQAYQEPEPRRRRSNRRRGKSVKDIQKKSIFDWEDKDKTEPDEYQLDSFVVDEDDEVEHEENKEELGISDKEKSDKDESGSDSDAEDVKQKLKDCLPLNMTYKDALERIQQYKQEDINVFESREKIFFDGMFGLDEHIQKLTEMVIFPMIYPDLYSNLNIKPSRGVLFYGPPGTGKTMMVSSLVNICAQHLNKPVAFYTRKGGDLLSKWVGEAERQLINLFDIATKTQPSIIFFDEIDGIAPVRSEKNQDHSHTSVVSTLLALMDGYLGLYL
jgi:SpoVK/Ycf46/Vps4 family AAA+-type ATPase